MFTLSVVLIILRQVLSVGSNVWLSKWSSDRNIAVNGTQDTEKRNMYLQVYGLLGAGDSEYTWPFFI